MEMTLTDQQRENTLKNNSNVYIESPGLWRVTKDRAFLFSRVLEGDEEKWVLKNINCWNRMEKLPRWGRICTPIKPTIGHTKECNYVSLSYFAQKPIKNYLKILVYKSCKAEMARKISKYKFRQNFLRGRH